MIDPRSVRTVFMGTPEFALATFQGLIDFGLDVVAAYTQPDRPSGRGKKLTPPPVKTLAESNGIRVCQPLKLRAPEVVEELQALAPELIVVVAYGQILPKSVLEIPRYGCISDEGWAYLETVIPEPVKKATYELALEILGGGISLTDTGLEGFEDVKVGPLSVTPRLSRAAGKLPENVMRHLRPLLVESSSLAFRMLRS